MNKKIMTPAVDELFDAILSLQSKEECYSFFEDLCTINELLSLSQRYEVASMMRDKKTYLEIAEKTGYKSSQYFSQVFNQRTGRRPLSFRQKKPSI